MHRYPGLNAGKRKSCPQYEELGSALVSNISDSHESLHPFRRNLTQQQMHR